MTDPKNYSCATCAHGIIPRPYPAPCPECVFGPRQDRPSNWVSAEAEATTDLRSPPSGAIPAQPVTVVTIDGKPMYHHNGFPVTAGDFVTGHTYNVKIGDDLAVIQPPENPSPPPPHYTSLRSLVDKANRLDNIRSALELLDRPGKRTVVYVGSNEVHIPKTAMYEMLCSQEALAVAELEQAGIDCTKLIPETRPEPKVKWRKKHDVALIDDPEAEED